ncbi:MAG: threonine ammonia-lyase [bacterium]
MTVSMDDIEAAAQRLSGHLVRTPFTQSQTLSAQLGCELFVKFENQQFTASFKERGALNSLLKHPSKVAAGVIAMSAGNHAQALAYHGTRLGIPTTIVMPRTTPNAKVEASRLLGAEVILQGSTFDETLQFTQDLSAERGLALIHPFDALDVIAGQGTVALEMLSQVKDLDVIVVPIGGGGLISGIATVVKALAPEIQVIGVQMERFNNAYRAFHHQPQESLNHSFTVAEGIAVKAPGVLTSAIIRDLVDDVQLVSEYMVEQAIFDLLEIEKTVAEGAGAAGLALVRSQPALFRGKRVGMLVCGGNIDMMILSSVLQRGLVRSHRLVRLEIEIPDTPGALANLTALLGDLDSNIVDISHQRAFGGSSVRATLVELVLQMRGEEQKDNVTQVLEARGYDVRPVI